MSLGRGLQLLKSHLRLTQGINHGFTAHTLSRALSSVPAGTVTHLAEQFRNCIWDRNTTDRPSAQLKEAYTALQDAVTDSPSQDDIDAIQQVITWDNIVDTLQVLATSKVHEDHIFLQNVLEYMHQLIGNHITSEQHTAILQGLAEARQTQALWRWFRVMATRPGEVSPTLDQLHIFLEYCVYEKKWKYMWKAVSLSQLHCKPTNETFKLLLWGIFREPMDHHREVHKVIKSICHSRLPFDSSILALIVRGLNRLGLVSQAAEAAKNYRAYVRPGHTSTARREHDSELARASAIRGRDVATKMYHSLRLRGFEASQDTLMALLESVWDIDSLVHWEKELGVKAEPCAWAILIRNALDTGSPEAAMEIYRQARAIGINPEYDVAYPVVRALCSTAPTRHSYDSSIDQALQIYEDYLATLQKRGTSRRSNTPTITAQRVILCSTLLRALSSSSNKAKYFPIAVDLLTGLRKDRVPLDSAIHTSILILLMRTSSSFAEAFHVYELFREHQQASLGARGFSAALNTFASLKFDNMTIPPWKDYFQIIKDMQRAGYRYTPRIYTNLLHQISRIARRHSADIAIKRQLSRVVVQIHKSLSLDPTITPDTACWNQLMDTYQRIQHYEGMHKVWEMLYVSGRVDNASLSIILDACSFSNDMRTARQVYKTFRGRFNTNNWYSWIECLCRLGRFDEGARLVCLEMGKSIPEVQPDEECVRILLKFAQSGKVLGQMRARIQQYLPELWQKVSESGDM
ncbi:hypothetical protein EVG20_g2464 [Dentipellis fragilis]|uniref:Pentacotripeptide-repeat region of PRORP domain-containing protein n=1 Tax=Dentipellis fragilis TaxID=205917 RepID=A0A4Y9Z807_9AGAM|nr:hypothetical protein EVG20_g2464 [Dentipellis fragilis]